MNLGQTYQTCLGACEVQCELDTVSFLLVQPHCRLGREVEIDTQGL